MSFQKILPFDLKNFDLNSFKSEILSGLTVALALVPEAIAFAFVAGVDPLVGLYAAFIVGLITSIFGGRPGMISGATGALAVVMVELVLHHGVEYLFATVVLMGCIQIGAGILKLGKFVRLIPHPVMLGFVNGLAIVIFYAQKNQFKIKNAANELVWMQGTQLVTMLALVFLTMVIIRFLPKLTKAVPSSLVAILTVTLLVNFFNLGTPTVGDIASVNGSFPMFHLPEVPFDLGMFKVIFPYAFILAAIGLIESLLTLTLIDELTETRGRGNKECIGQGLANVVTGFFGGMGGCAMIGQSIININSGGKKRLSGIVASLSLLFFILYTSSMIERIPLAALTGVMFMVVISTFEWSTLRMLHKIPKSDALVIILVTVVTLTHDLAAAVGVGIIVSALVFAWEASKKLKLIKEDGTKGEKIYTLQGNLFFASSKSFISLFNPEQDPDEVFLSFKDSKVFDHSGLEAIHSLDQKYKKLGKKLHLSHLSSDCRELLNKAGALIEVNVIEDPKYSIADDQLA